MAQQLRQYQSDALNQLRSNLGKGIRTQILQLATGGGKTTVASALMQGAVAKGNRVYFIVDSLELVDQAAERFIADGLQVGIIQGDHWMTDYSKPIQVATIQTLKNRWHQITPALRPQVVVIDECFTGDTLISTPKGDIKMDLVRCGDYVYNAIGVGVVEAVSAKSSEKIKVLEFDDGTITECTENHPFFTSQGWVEAGKLEIGTITASREDVRMLQCDVLSNKKRIHEGKNYSSEREGVEQKEVLLNILLKESREPYAGFRSKGGNEENIKKNWSQAKDSRRERGWLDGSSSGCNGDSRGQLEAGVYIQHWDGEGEGRVSNTLQTGYSQPREDDLYRARRRESWGDGKKKTRQEERFFFGGKRLVGVSDKQLSSSEVVYNLQVSGHPSYFANGSLVHNCHVIHTMHKAIIEECKFVKCPIIGLSATPFRKGLGLIFDDLVVGATTAMLTDMGYLVPAVCYAPFVPDLKGIRTSSDGDWIGDALSDLMGDAQIVGDIVTNWLKLAKGRQTIVFCANVAHSKMVCEYFNRAGVVADHIDGYESDKEARTERINAFRRGETTVLCNVAVLTKGFDAPETSCVVLARPTKSLMLHIQMIGRGLRTADHKTNCIVIDHAGNCLRNGLPTDDLPETLDMGKGDNPDRKERDKKEPVNKACGQCGHVSTKFICPVCGHKPERMQDIEVKDGELYEIEQQPKPKFTAEEKQLLISELYGYAISKGFKHGWVSHKFQSYTGEYFKTWHNIPPRPPSEKTMGIIKHLNIKNAKRRG